MIELLFYTVASFGFAYAVGSSKVSLSTRENVALFHRGLTDWLLEMVECPACFGFWIGLVTGLVAPDLVPFRLGAPLAALALAFYSCGSGFLLGRATGLIRD